MGYTNYYYQKPNIKEFPENFVNEIKALEKVAKRKKIDCSFSYRKNCVIIDGPCENLVFKTNAKREKWMTRTKDGGVFGFCKTAREPYDAVIKAAIMAAFENGIVYNWSFDGDTTEEEYENGVKIAQKAGIEIIPPHKEEFEEA